jgi:hypothetical protein
MFYPNFTEAAKERRQQRRRLGQTSFEEIMSKPRRTHEKTDCAS